MATLTNTKDLPGPFVEAIRNDPYDRGAADISVTGLLAPPRQAALVEEFGDHIVEDASDRIWSLLGKSVHYVLEQSSDCGISEERLYMDINGWTVSGQFDHLSLRSDMDEDGSRLILTDWKVTSVWTVIKGDRASEWEKQLNTYAYLLRQHGYEVDSLQVLAILRDWQKSKSQEDNYPEAAAVKVDLLLWSEEEQLDFIQQRVALHQAARFKLPQCSSEDRWAKPETYAVYGYTKAGTRRARATRVFNVYDDAVDYIADHKDEELELETREGDQWVRCRDYCAAAHFCTQFQEGGS